MDLNAFPDPVLRAVFDRVPLLDLGRHIPLVCHRWHSLQPSVLLSKKNMALTLMIGKDAPRVIDESQVLIKFEDQLTNEDGRRMYPSPMDDPRLALTLTLTTLTSERVDLLIDKLGDSKVSYLKLCFCKRPPIADVGSIPLIIHLLEHWGQCLTTLKLHCLFVEEDENPLVLTPLAEQLGLLIETVNKLPLLEHLTLDLHEDLQMTTQLELPILARLKEFYFNSNTIKLDLLNNSLKHYAEPNDKLHSIGLGQSGDVREYLAEFGESTLAKRFTMLTRLYSYPYHNPIPNIRDQEQILNTFTSQVTFRISMKNLNLVRLTTILSPLQSLVHLKLFCVAPFTKYDTDPVDEIRPLPSVKVLSLVVATRSHKELASKHWERMFPNLQIVMLFHIVFGCTICGVDDDAREMEPEKVTPCVQRTLLTFKQQFRRTLKKVYYCRNRLFHLYRPNVENTTVFTLDSILDVYHSDDE